MKKPDVFQNPDLVGFDDYRHVSGVRLPVTGELHALQEDLLGCRLDSLGLGERRNYFTTLEQCPSEEIAFLLRNVLEVETLKVERAVEEILGREVIIDAGLSGIWIETGSTEQNKELHRDADEPEIVRMTFSVSPTRLLASDVKIPLDGDSWDSTHYPMGPVFLRGGDFESHLAEIGEDDYSGLMTGTTYHRAPTDEELRKDFERVFGKGIPKSIPRIFGSIWGKIAS